MKDVKNFNHRIQLGKVGERIVAELLEEKGYCIHPPSTKGRHWIDIIAINNQKGGILWAEVKTKPKMKAYNATGININHLEDYKRLMKIISNDIMLFFIDTASNDIYCGSLTELLKPKIYAGITYPNYDITKDTVLFPLEEMKIIRTLTPNEISELKKYSLS